MKIPDKIPAWKQAPLIKYLLPFGAGIIMQDKLAPDFHIACLLVVAFLSLAIISNVISTELYFRFRKSAGLTLQLLLFFLGSIIHNLNDTRKNPSWYGARSSDSSVYIARIIYPPEEKTNTYKAIATIISVHNKNAVASQSLGNVLVYFSKKDSMQLPEYNQVICFSKTMSQIRNNGNPGDFDYVSYSKRQQLFHQVFLSRNDFILSPVNKTASLKSFLFDARDNILSILRSRFKDEKVLGITEALLIGYKNDLDSDLVKAYSVTGIVHIIAISGLHLGLIYWMLELICGFAGFLKKIPWLKILIIVSSLWLFALLTGGSASVLRSALMFTFIIAGKQFARSASIYNSIACSAFILLCYDSHLLWDVGYQLSYLAVIGIVWLQDPIKKLLFIKNKLLKKAWDMASVTIAAQIMAFPLCLFYFHQFPNLFLVANLIEVPVSTIVLFAEIILITFSSFDFLAELVSTSINFLVNIMNSVAEFLSGIPYASWEGIYSNVASTITLYFAIYFCIQWIRLRTHKYFASFLLLLLAWLSIFWVEACRASHTRQLIIYNFPKVSYLEIQSGNMYTGVLNSATRPPVHTLKQAHFSAGMKDSVPLRWPGSIRNQLIHFGALKLLWLVKQPRHEQLPSYADLILLSNNVNVDLKEIHKNTRCSLVILDNSNSLWKIEKWKRECEELILPSHSTSEQGAFIIDIP